MTEHTPGPWSITTDEPGGEICTVYQVTRQPTEDGLGQAWVYIRAQHSLFRDPDEQFSNAQLIASAPELLAFVEKMKQMLLAERDCFYEGCCDGDGHVPYSQDQDILKSMDDDIDKATALIAKARAIK